MKIKTTFITNRKISFTRNRWCGKGRRLSKAKVFFNNDLHVLGGCVVGYGESKEKKKEGARKRLRTITRRYEYTGGIR